MLPFQDITYKKQAIQSAPQSYKNIFKKLSREIVDFCNDPPPILLDFSHTFVFFKLLLGALIPRSVCRSVCCQTVCRSVCPPKITKKNTTLYKTSQNIRKQVGLSRATLEFQV